MPGRKTIFLLTVFTLLCADPVAAQQPPGKAKRPYVELTTSDGSRFLLVPSIGAPVIQWVVMTPAGIAEDPLGLEGLSYAVARASLSGTTRFGSKDWDKERPALDAQDLLEEKVAQLESSESAVPAELLTQLKAARHLAETLADPFSWRRTLNASPAIDLDLHETREATLLRVTTTVTGFPRVARLLMARREDAQLRGFHRYFSAVRAEFDRRQLWPLAALRSEMLGLAFLGQGEGRTTDRALSTCPRSRALESFQRSQQPGRSYHVITGAFKIEDIKAVLEAIFTNTELPPTPIPPHRVHQGKGRVRQSSITGGDRQAYAIGCQLADDSPPDTLAVLVEWLAGSDDAYLPSGLRRLGHKGLEVSVHAPFPGNAKPGLLLLEVWERKQPKADASRIQMSKITHKLINEAIRKGPSPIEIDRALARLRSQRADALVDTRATAYHLALACGIRGEAPEAAMRERATVTALGVQALAKQLFQKANRTYVTMERSR